jgi:putative ABC transport system ATP-binding protein
VTAPDPVRPVLALQGVTKRFPSPAGPVPVLRGVDLELRPGDFAAITGPSGSGKTTLLNLASLLDVPTTGRVWLDGRDVSALDPDALGEARSGRIGMVFQHFHLLRHRTARENVEFRFRYLPVDRAEARRRAEAALATVGLEHAADRPARLLSGGEQQRVAIARAVAAAPVLLVADEPTGNLDAASARMVMDLFQGMNRAGLTILLVTHNDALLAYCTRHLVCREGRVAEAARPSAPGEGRP